MAMPMPYCIRHCPAYTLYNMALALPCICLIQYGIGNAIIFSKAMAMIMQSNDNNVKIKSKNFKYLCYNNKKG